MADDKSGATTTPNNQEVPPVSALVTTPESPEENVTLSKKEHDELRRQATIAATAQSKADKLERELRQVTKRRVPIEPLQFQVEEVAEVKRRITTAVLTTERYQRLINASPLLAKIIAKNPLELVESQEFIDVEDAVDQVLESLDQLATSDIKIPTAEIPPVSPSPETVPPTSHSSVTPPVNALPIDEGKAERERLARLSPMERIKAKIAGKVTVKP